MSTLGKLLPRKNTLKELLPHRRWTFTQRYTREKLPEWVRNILPVPKEELMFKDFPKQPGHVGTLGGILLVNGCVWYLWQDPANEQFMQTHFMHHNDDWSHGRWHTIFTSSISHQSWNHLFGNMVIFTLLGKKVHQLVGRARFCLLYAMGACGGGVASTVDPAMNFDNVAHSAKRYLNIAIGRSPGEQRGLGASDAVMAILAAFYLTFPRTPVPIFRRFHLITQGVSSILPKLGQRLEKIPILNLKMSAVWLLPMYFVGDWMHFYSHMVEWNQDREHYSVPFESIGYAAHVGGMMAGGAFYLLVAHPIKRLYFDFTVHEMTRRAFIMIAGLTFWSGFLFNSIAKKMKKEGYDSVLVYGYRKEISKDIKKADGTTEKQVRTIMQPISKPVLGVPVDLLLDANRCSIMETCWLTYGGGQGKEYGHCDKSFAAVHDWTTAVYIDDKLKFCNEPGHKLELVQTFNTWTCRACGRTSSSNKEMKHYRGLDLAGCAYDMCRDCYYTARNDKQYWALVRQGISYSKCAKVVESMQTMETRQLPYSLGGALIIQNSLVDNSSHESSNSISYDSQLSCIWQEDSEEEQTDR